MRWNDVASVTGPPLNNWHGDPLWAAAPGTARALSRDARCLTRAQASDRSQAIEHGVRQRRDGDPHLVVNHRLGPRISL
jgi:hypothetical protein